MANEQKKLDLGMNLWKLAAALFVGVGAIISDYRSERRLDTAMEIISKRLDKAMEAISANAAQCKAAVASITADLKSLRETMASTSTSPAPATTPPAPTPPAATTSATTNASGRRVLTIVVLIGVAIILCYGVRRAIGVYSNTRDIDENRRVEREDLLKLMRNALTSMNLRMNHRREDHVIILQPTDDLLEIMRAINLIIEESPLPPEIREILSQLKRHVVVDVGSKMIYVSEDICHEIRHIEQYIFPQTSAMASSSSQTQNRVNILHLMGVIQQNNPEVWDALNTLERFRQTFSPVDIRQNPPTSQEQKVDEQEEGKDGDADALRRYIAKGKSKVDE